LVATSVLPISKETLVYGSSDGGVHFLDKSPEIKELITKVCVALNLKKHVVVDASGNSSEIFSPSDIEGSFFVFAKKILRKFLGHLGKDGRFYCVDLVCKKKNLKKIYTFIE
jgi:hypothetical protein